MAYKENIKIEISTDKGPFTSYDFIQFLSFFRAVYVAAVIELSDNPRTSRFLDWPLEEIDEKILIDSVQILERRFNGKFPIDVGHLSSYPLNSRFELEIADIHRRNPVDIVFIAVPLAIAVVAVVAAGGMIIAGKTLTLPSLRRSLDNLRGFSSEKFE